MKEWRSAKNEMAARAMIAIEASIIEEDEEDIMPEGDRCST